MTINATGNTFSYVYLSLLRPDGTPVIDRSGFSGATRFLDTVDPRRRRHLHDRRRPRRRGDGSVDLKVGDVPPDVKGSLTLDGAAKQVTFTAPGQNAALTFSSAAGRRVALTATSISMNDYVDYELHGPDGSRLYGSYVGVGGRNWSDALTLPTAGQYTLKIDPENQAVGTASFRLASVPADTTGTITPGGPARTVTTVAPGQNASLTFTGTAGQRVALTAVSTTMNDYENFAIFAPGGTRLYNSYVGAGGRTWSDAVTLTANGTYTIKIDPEDEGTGNVTYQLATVPADATGTMTVDGPNRAVTITAPGQNAQLTFAGTAGQQVVLTATSTTRHRLRRLPAPRTRRRPGPQLLRRRGRDEGLADPDAAGGRHLHAGRRPGARGDRPGPRSG